MYNDGYVDGIINAFNKHPDADLIIFNINDFKDGNFFNNNTVKEGRLKLKSSLKFGSCSLCIKRKSLMDFQVRFSELFGGGCVYSLGEDSLFIKDCFKNKMKVYGDSYNLGYTVVGDSTCFFGYNEKFFYDKGAWLNFAFPKLKVLLKYYFALRFIKKSDLGFIKIIKLIKAGIKGSKNLISYGEYFGK